MAAVGGIILKLVFLTNQDEREKHGQRMAIKLALEAVWPSQHDALLNGLAITYCFLVHYQQKGTCCQLVLP
jgi:hypothetical protein